jgi:hypothetical protein
LHVAFKLYEPLPQGQKENPACHCHKEDKD